MGRRIELGHRPPVARQQSHPRLAQGHGGEAVGQEGGVVGASGAGVAAGNYHSPEGRGGAPWLARRQGEGRSVRLESGVSREGDELTQRGRFQASAQPAGVAGEGPHGDPRQRLGRRCARPPAQGVGERQAGRRTLRAPTLQQRQRSVPNLLERLQFQSRLARQHTAGGSSPLRDGAVHPGKCQGTIALQRPESVDGGGVVARGGEALGPQAAQLVGVLGLPAALQAGHGFGEDA